MLTCAALAALATAEWAGATSPLMSESEVEFERVGFGALPGWAEDDHGAAFRAFLKSCICLEQASRNGALPAGAVSPALMEACRKASSVRSSGAAEARRFFEAAFTPHRVLHKSREGLLTGYYEPVVEGSRTRQGRFQIPIYRRPPDLVNLVDDSARGTVGTALTHARRTAAGLAPYPTRAEIESGALAGQGLELFYLEDAVEAFFMQVQGSGRIKLPDGSSVRVTYDGKNGHPYTSLGRHLIETGALAAGDVTLDSIARWLRADPERGRRAMWKNESFVFFRELAGDEAGSARGVFGFPLTPGRSLAVDTSVHSLGTPIFVVAPTLVDAIGRGPFRRLMIAQDVGSAIRGPERGDIFFGSGKPAGRRAGSTKHAGNFFVLLPSPAMDSSQAEPVSKP